MITTFYHYSESSKLDVNVITGICTKSIIEGFKPDGLWLSYDENGSGWADWCIAEQFRLESLGFKYELRINMDDIFVIDSYNKLVDFIHKYKSPNDDITPQEYMRWDAVKHQHKGVAFVPYNKAWCYYIPYTNIGLHALWYSGIDCESACLWDPSAIVSCGPAAKTGLA